MFGVQLHAEVQYFISAQPTAGSETARESRTHQLTKSEGPTPTPRFIAFKQYTKKTFKKRQRALKLIFSAVWHSSDKDFCSYVYSTKCIEMKQERGLFCVLCIFCFVCVCVIVFFCLYLFLFFCFLFFYAFVRSFACLFVSMVGCCFWWKWIWREFTFYSEHEEIQHCADRGTCCCVHVCV